MTNDPAQIANAVLQVAYKQGQEAFITALTQFLETLPPNQEGERYQLMQLPDGFNYEAAWRAGEQSAIGVMTVRFSVFAQDIEGCLETLKSTAEMNGIAIASCEKFKPWQYRLKFAPRFRRGDLSFFLDTICYENTDNVPGDDASQPLSWTKAYSEVAQRYGWDVLDEPGGPILALWGEPPQFDSDEDVWLKVFEIAQSSYSPADQSEAISHRDACRQAIDYIAQRSIDAYNQLAEFVEQAQQQIAENHAQLSEYGIVSRDEDEWQPGLQPASDRD